MTMAWTTGGSLLAVTAAALMVGCGGTTDPGGGGGGTGGGGGGGGGGTGSVVVIDIQNFAFNGPDGSDVVVVSLGDTIRWVNGDAEPHTASSTDVPAGGNSFGSANLGTGQTFEFVPNVTGTWTYRCNVHPTTMFGATIVVQ